MSNDETVIEVVKNRYGLSIEQIEIERKKYNDACVECDGLMFSFETYLATIFPSIEELNN